MQHHRVFADPVAALKALDSLCIAVQREEIARRAYTKARGVARRAQVRVDKLEGRAGTRRAAGPRS